MRAVPFRALDKMDVLQSRRVRFDRFDKMTQHHEIRVDRFRLTGCMIEAGRIEDMSRVLERCQILPGFAPILGGATSDIRLKYLFR